MFNLLPDFIRCQHLLYFLDLGEVLLLSVGSTTVLDRHQYIKRLAGQDANEFIAGRMHEFMGKEALTAVAPITGSNLSWPLIPGRSRARFNLLPPRTVLDYQLIQEYFGLHDSEPVENYLRSKYGAASYLEVLAGINAHGTTLFGAIAFLGRCNARVFLATEQIFEILPTSDNEEDSDDDATQLWETVPATLMVVGCHNQSVFCILVTRSEHPEAVVVD